VHPQRRAEEGEDSDEHAAQRAELLEAVRVVDDASQPRAILGSRRRNLEEIDLVERRHAVPGCIRRAARLAFSRRVLHCVEMSEEREARRRKEREEQRRREEELEKIHGEPRLPSFEAPATGKVVENPPRDKPPKKP